MVFASPIDVLWSQASWTPASTAAESRDDRSEGKVERAFRLTHPELAIRADTVSSLDGKWEIATPPDTFGE